MSDYEDAHHDEREEARTLAALSDRDPHGPGCRCTICCLDEMSPADWR